MKKTTVGILAHVDAGKTTLAEALLFSSGAIRTQGRVDAKNTALDTHQLEKERGITIFTGEAVFTSGDTEITLLDTPGHVDFSAETERTLNVLDYAVLVISASDGVQAHTRTVWRLLEIYGIPVFLFVTKCDMERRTRESLLDELQKEFGAAEDFSKDGFERNESVAMHSEALLDEYLAFGRMSTATLAEAIRSRKLFPCFFGSGLKNDGVKEFAASLDKYTLPREYPLSFGARVYKIAHDKNERITKMRVTGGRLRVKDTVEYNGISEKVNQIRIYSGAKYVTVDEAEAGTVCAVTGLTATAAGQGLGCESGSSTGILEPVMRYRIVLPKDADARIMLQKLKGLEEEEPELNITYSEFSGEFHCTLMGKVQAEIFKSIVHERFDTDIGIAEGKVIYRETVKNTVEGVGHFEPLRHYAEVHLIIEPAPANSGITFASVCSEAMLDRSWQRLVLTHLKEKTHLGVLTGSPLTDVKISLASGRAHLKHTEGGDFRQATYRAVRHGLMHAASVLLEPYYGFRLEVPVKYIGRAINDIKLMGGSFSQPQNDGEVALLKGKAPVVEMDGYMAEVASFTGGLGRLSTELVGYGVCHNADEVIRAVGYEAEHDTENTADSVFCAHGAGFNVNWRDVCDYMHLESCFSARKKSEYVHRSISIDEKELEAIMLREFGPVKTELYRPVSHKYDMHQADIHTQIKQRCLIIDGYNVIFNWQMLREIAETDLDGARDKLCHILSNYAMYTGMRTVAVFDGYKVKGNTGEKSESHGVDIVFTKENETADNYIEKLINEIGKNEQVRVVTSDAMIQLTAVHSGVLRMSSAEFEDEIARVDGEIAELIEKVNFREASRKTKGEQI